MKKQALTRQDIQKELLTKLNTRKSIAVFLTVVASVAIILYPIRLINYLNGAPFDGAGGFGSSDLTSTAAMLILPLAIIFLTAFVFGFYYIDLYKIKKGRFEITEDTVYQKCKEWRRYYKHNSREENSLYFRCGRMAVEDHVYSYSNAGDRFYVIMLKSKKEPQLAYHTKYFEIDLG